VKRMGKLYFLFGVHNHQPVGNFVHIFEQAFEKCYAPFISILREFPRIKCNLHISGCLYDWILQNRRDFIKKVKEMVDKGQIEIISGGYYEPILPLISNKDKFAQIKFMNSFIEKTFKKRPQGLWLTERIWEPYLARIISEVNLKYTFLDDTHFRYAGLQKKEFFDYYVTEDCLKSIFIFPISKTLRYKIPFSQPQEAIDILKSFFSSEEERVITLFDDGEKFGLWPHTFEWVYNQGWLRSFFTLLDKNIDTIETITASEAIKMVKSRGIVYLPTASYEEMGEWVLEPENFTNYQALCEYLKQSEKFDKFKDFIRGGFFRNFYRKYPRLNYMHKRMLFVSEKIHNAGSLSDKESKLNLWKAQCNCGYWHGIFGGFYLGHIRAAIYEHLIKAEKKVEEKLGKKEVYVEKFDIDLDGREETLLKNKSMVCVFADKGGTLLELSLRTPPFNLINTVTRRQESYHRKVKANEEKAKGEGEVTTIHQIVRSKEKGLDEFLIYDKYERLGLVDLILKKDFTLEDFNKQEKLKPLSNQPYRSFLKERNNEIILEYFYPFKKEREDELEFCKRIIFGSLPQLKVSYCFKNNKLLKNYNFGVEINLSLPSLEGILIAGNPLPQEGKIVKKTSSLHIEDQCKGIEVTFKFNKADVYLLPVYIVSSSESGFEKSYQQIAVLFITTQYKSPFTLSINLSNH